MRYVLAVAETASFTRAAERCFVVQSALSHQVAAAERELGFALFARTSRRVQLTAAGAAFLPEARRCLESADRAVADAAAAVGQVRGRLTVGVIPTVTAVDVPDVLRRFRQDHPQVWVSLRVGGSQDLTTGVREGVVDAAVVGLPDDDRPRGVAFRALARDRLVVVVDPQHVLAGATEVGLARLAEETFVDFPEGTPGRIQGERAFTAAGIHREVAFEIMATDMMAGLVRQGLAVGLLPGAYARTLPGLVTVPITDGPHRVEHLVWSDFNPSPATVALLAEIGIDGRTRS